MATPKEQRDARPHAIVVNPFEQRRERERAREACTEQAGAPPAEVTDGAPPDAPAPVP